MSTRPRIRSSKPWPTSQPAAATGARRSRWAAAWVLALPLLASAAPLLTVGSGRSVGSTGCLVLQEETATSGPLTHNQNCTDSRLGVLTADAFATADFGSLGASTFLTLLSPPLVTPGNTGFAHASFEGDYVFSGSGSSVVTSLNLDLDGRMVVSGLRSSSNVQMTLGGPGFFMRASITVFEDRPAFIVNGLDADADFDVLLDAAGGSVEIDTNAFAVRLGEPVHLALGLVAGGAVGGHGGGGFLTSLTDFGSTLTFNRDGPVFALPAGFTVNGPGVVDNRWVGADIPVPEPATTLLAGLALVALAGLRRRVHGDRAAQRVVR